MLKAIVSIRDQAVRKPLIRKRLDQIAKFSWETMAQVDYQAICQSAQFNAQQNQNHLTRYWRQYRKVLRDL